MEHKTGCRLLVQISIATQVVEVLLAEDSRAFVAASSLFENGSWQEAFTLARAWKVTPPLAGRVQSLKLKMPPAENANLRREFLKMHGQSAFRASQAIRAIQCLEQAGIAVVAFKGIASMAVLYGDPRHRTIHDADLLVRPSDVAGAVACLERQGFARAGRESLAEYVQFVGNSPGFAGNKAVTLYGAGGGEIDLHWELRGSGLTTVEILQRAVTARLMGAEIPVVDCADGFLLTIHHTIRENLAVESVLRDLLDIRLWCQRLQDNGQLESAMRRAVHAGGHVSALAVTSLLNSYDATPGIRDAVAWLQDVANPGERLSASRLMELFQYQLAHGRMEKDVLYLVHSHPWSQILRGLGADWSGYRRSMHTIEKQLGEERPWLQRVSLLAKSIPGLRGLKLARELARVKYGAN